MSAQAGYPFRIRITATNIAAVAADDVVGADNVDFERGNEMLETTNFSDNGDRSFIPGLRNTTLSYECDYDPAQTAQARVETGYTNRSSVWAHVLRNGTAGHKVECHVENISLSVGAADKLRASVTLRPTGAVAVV